MTFICTYCGEWIDEKWVSYDQCTRCGEPRKKDKAGREIDRKRMNEIFRKFLE